MSTPESGPPKLFTVGTVSLAIGVAFGMLAKTDFGSRDSSAPEVVMNSQLDRAYVTRHCRNVLEKIEQRGLSSGTVARGFVERYLPLCEDTSRTQ